MLAVLIRLSPCKTSSKRRAHRPDFFGTPLFLRLRPIGLALRGGLLTSGRSPHATPSGRSPPNVQEYGRLGSFGSATRRVSGFGTDTRNLSAAAPYGRGAPSPSPCFVLWARRLSLRSL